MKGLLEYKTITAELKDVDIKSMTVSGWYSSYGNKDHDKDIIEPGAGRKTIAERGPLGSNEIFFLNQHDWKQPHGKPSVLEEHERGGYFESKVAPTSYGKDAIVLYDAGIVIQHSFGFQTVKSEDRGNYKDGTFTRHIKEYKMFELSNVTLGANPKTPFTGFKALTFEQANDQINAIVKLLRNGSLTDDTFTTLEIALKQLQLHSFELGKKSLEEQKEPIIEVTLIEPEPMADDPKEKEQELIKIFKNFSLN